MDFSFKLKSCFFVFLVFYFPGILLAQPTLVLDERDAPFSTVAHAFYYVDRAATPLTDVRRIPDRAWTPGGRNLRGLKNTLDDVWIRIDLVNESKSDVWIYWTPIHWQEHRPQGYCLENPDAGELAGAAGIPIRFTNYGGRAHVFKMTLPGRSCRVFVRIRTQLSKIIFQEIGRPEVYHAENASIEFLNGIFFFCLGAMLLLTLLFFWKYRETPALIYACALFFFGIWQGVNFGYVERLWIFQTLGVERTGVLAPGTLGILIMFFWKRLLFLPAYAPAINRFLNFLFVPAFLLFGASLLPDPALGTISRLSKGVFTVITFVLCAAAFVAARRGFRPAIFSFSGNLVFVLALTTFFSFTSLHFLPGFRYVLYIPFTGFLFEAVFFLISLVSRQKIIDTVGSRGIELAAFESREAEKNPNRTSRLAGADIADLHDKLVRAMEEEKLYRDELTLAGLATHLGLTEKDLSELLNYHLKQNFYGLVNSYRVQEACRLLVEQPERTILSIGFEAGFSSLSTFNNAFSRQTGMSPKKYRKSSLPGIAG